MAPSKLQLSGLNHISQNCASVEESLNFYVDVLGFVEIKRPVSFDFDGAWLFNYGVGIHLLKDDRLTPGHSAGKKINTKGDHISFQCDDITLVEKSLEEKGIFFIRQEVEEGGILVDQLFFHDPDGHMIEICNCQLLPVVPLTPNACIGCKIPKSVEMKSMPAKKRSQKALFPLECVSPTPLLHDVSLSAASSTEHETTGTTDKNAIESYGFCDWKAMNGEEKKDRRGFIVSVHNANCCVEEAPDCGQERGPDNILNPMNLLQKATQEVKRKRDEVAPCA